MFKTKLSVAKAIVIGGSGVAALSVATQANAAAFYLQEQSVRAVGRAFSGEVADTGAASLWWNPASIGGISTMDGYLGFNAILPTGDSSNVNTLIVRPGQAPRPVGGDQVSHDPIDNGVLPTGGFAIPLSNRLAVGFVASSPFSFTTNYPLTSWARYDATKTRLRTYDLQPTVAFMVAPGLSIGGGANVERTIATLANAVPDPISPLLPDAQERLHGTGWNVGWSVGAQYHVATLDLGISYKSAVHHDLKGSFSITGNQNPVLAPAINETLTDVMANFVTPWQLNVGARAHLTPKLTLNGQFTRFGWSEFNSIKLPSLNSAIPENYKDTSAYAVGFDYAASPKLMLRGGVQRDLSPVPNGYRDPRVPDGNRWNFAAGASYAMSPQFTIDVAASYDKIESNPIDRPNAAYAGTPLQTAILTSGDLSNAHAVVLGLGGRFHF